MELTVADSSPKRETPSVQCNLIPETDSWTIFSRPAPVVPVFIRNEAQSLGAIAAPVQAPNSGFLYNFDSGGHHYQFSKKSGIDLIEST